MVIKVITPPNEEPITLDDMKSYLRVDDDNDNMLISSLITAAREYCEGFQNRAYFSQTIELTMDHFPGQRHMRFEEFPFIAFGNGDRNRHHHKVIKLPMPPLQSVLSITYTDDSGATTTLDSSSYVVDADSEPGRLAPASGKDWPNVKLQPINGVRVRYIAGFENVGLIPKSINQAIMMLVAHWYENRSPVGTVGEEIAFAIKAILSQNRVIPT